MSALERIAASRHPLDGTTSPMLRALPDYQRQFQAHLAEASAYWEASQQRLGACARLVGEQEVQVRAGGRRGGGCGGGGAGVGWVGPARASAPPPRSPHPPPHPPHPASPPSQAFCIDAATSNVEAHYAYICSAHSTFMARYTVQHATHSGARARTSGAGGRGQGGAGRRRGVPASHPHCTHRPHRPHARTHPPTLPPTCVPPDTLAHLEQDLAFLASTPLHPGLRAAEQQQQQQEDEEQQRQQQAGGGAAQQQQQEEGGARWGTLLDLLDAAVLRERAAACARAHRHFAGRVGDLESLFGALRWVV